jgi:hypothetical protein
MACSLLLACGVFGLAATPAAADPISFSLDQSNTLANGVVYGTVKVQAFTNLGEVQLTYTADPSVYRSVGKNFGFHTIGFNTDLSLHASQFTLPAGWKLGRNANLSEFGEFSWKATTAHDEAPSITVQIDGLGNNATVAHFTLPSHGRDSVFFTGHIMDFSSKRCGVTSQWVGGSSDPPAPPGGQGGPPSVASEPPTLAMGAAAVAGLALVRVTRRRRARRIIQGRVGGRRVAVDNEPPPHG